MLSAVKNRKQIILQPTGQPVKYPCGLVQQEDDRRHALALPKQSVQPIYKPFYAVTARGPLFPARDQQAGSLL